VTGFAPPQSAETANLLAATEAPDLGCLTSNKLLAFGENAALTAANARIYNAFFLIFQSVIDHQRKGSI
jgi:hypothetical protein